MKTSPTQASVMRFLRSISLLDKLVMRFENISRFRDLFRIKFKSELAFSELKNWVKLLQKKAVMSTQKGILFSVDFGLHPCFRYVNLTPAFNTIALVKH